MTRREFVFALLNVCSIGVACYVVGFYAGVEHEGALHACPPCNEFHAVEVEWPELHRGAPALPKYGHSGRQQRIVR